MFDLRSSFPVLYFVRIFAVQTACSYANLFSIIIVYFKIKKNSMHSLSLQIYFALTRATICEVRKRDSYMTYRENYFD